MVVDVHCHNDFGLAVANSLSAVEAGARRGAGLRKTAWGERAGNANLAETVMSFTPSTVPYQHKDAIPGGDGRDW